MLKKLCMVGVLTSGVEVVHEIWCLRCSCLVPLYGTHLKSQGVHGYKISKQLTYDSKGSKWWGVGVAARAVGHTLVGWCSTLTNIIFCIYLDYLAV